MDNLNPVIISDIRIAKIDFVLNFLKEVPQYASLDNLYLGQVDVMEVTPLARYVVKNRLLFTRSIVSAMVKAGVDLYKPIFLRHSAKQWRLIMPPVIEKHENKWIIFDGLHRFWLARQKGITHLWVLCIDNPPLPLPSTPISWDQVTLTDLQPSVSENLTNIKESLIRPLSRIFKSPLTLFDNIEEKIDDPSN